jgi:hypothetical protein
MFADDGVPPELPQWIIGGSVTAVFLGVIYGLAYFINKVWPGIGDFLLKRQGQAAKEKSDRQASDDNLYREGFGQGGATKTEELARAYRMIDSLQSD